MAIAAYMSTAFFPRDEMVLVCVPIPEKDIVKWADHVVDVNFRL